MELKTLTSTNQVKNHSFTHSLSFLGPLINS